MYIRCSHQLCLLGYKLTMLTASRSCALMLSIQSAIQSAMLKAQAVSFQWSLHLDPATATRIVTRLPNQQTFSESTGHSDVQVLLAWSSTKVLVSFRGTASLANALADIQVTCPSLFLQECLPLSTALATPGLGRQFFVSFGTPRLGRTALRITALQ